MAKPACKRMLLVGDEHKGGTKALVQNHAAWLQKRGCEVDIVTDRDSTLEDHSRVGGFGSTVLECLACHGPVRAQVQVMGVPDEILEHMSRNQILEHCGLTAAHVVERFVAEKTAPAVR